MHVVFIGAAFPLAEYIATIGYIKPFYSMEANGDSVVAGAGSSENVRATGISFSITKKSALHAHVGAGGPTGEREGPLGAVAGVNGGDEGEKDMVFSLEGGQIHR